MDGGNNWLATKIEALRKENPEQMIAVVATQTEIKSGQLDDIMGSQLSKSLEFRQDLNMSSAVWLYAPQRLLLLQKSQDKDGASTQAIQKSYRHLGTIACAKLREQKASKVHFLLSDEIANSDMVGLFENGYYLTNWENSWKRQDGDKNPVGDEGDERVKRINKKIDSYTISCRLEDKLQSDDAKFWRIQMRATEYARTLCNTRGSHGTPNWMEQRVHELCKDKAAVKEVRVLDSQKLQQLGMNLFYNVGKGSIAIDQPRCVMVHYVGDPSRPDDVDFAFVGKGITYDTGGLNIKGTGFMEEMYGDKGGSCAVLGALHGTLEQGFKKNIIFACAFAENSIGNAVYKPGDILVAMNGLSVEIGNTDAEGRLVLGDTFTYVQREFKPKQLIDLATLTGAVIVSLGYDTAGVFSEEDELVEELMMASKQSFEPIWRMPITTEHRESIKGQYGDIVNIGNTRMGGASQAAAFLERFVEGDTKWAHLDIAGPAMAKVAKPPACADQTGFAAALLLNFIKNKN